MTALVLALGLALGASLAGCAASAPPASTSSATAAQVATPTDGAATGEASAEPSATAAAPAAAPVVVEELGRGEQEAAVDLEVAGPAQVAFRRITIAPGAGTGLHCHDGQLIAVVEQGVLTHYAPVYPGGVHEYQAGDAIIEGAHYVHEGKNLGTEDVVLLVTYVIAEGDPLAETDLTKCEG